MANESIILAFVGVLELIIILLVFAIPVVLIVLLVRYILRERQENIRLRLEVGKLADELERARKKEGKNDREFFVHLLAYL